MLFRSGDFFLGWGMYFPLELCFLPRFLDNQARKVSYHETTAVLLMSLHQLTLLPVSNSSSGDAPDRCVMCSLVSLFLYLGFCAHVFHYDLTPIMICPQPSFSVIITCAFALSSVRPDFPTVLPRSAAECAVWGVGMHKLLLCLQNEKKKKFGQFLN